MVIIKVKTFCRKSAIELAVSIKQNFSLFQSLPPSFPSRTSLRPPPPPPLLSCSQIASAFCKKIEIKLIKMLLKLFYFLNSKKTLLTKKFLALFERPLNNRHQESYATKDDKNLCKLFFFAACNNKK